MDNTANLEDLKQEIIEFLKKKKGIDFGSSFDLSCLEIDIKLNKKEKIDNGNFKEIPVDGKESTDPPNSNAIHRDST